MVSSSVKKCLVLCFILLLLPDPAKCFSKELESYSPQINMTGLPSSVSSPEKLAEWMSKELSYRMEFPDKWQTPEETLVRRKGDCEDFALLASTFLNSISISNDIVIVEFRDLGVSHALCVWKDTGGGYNFISNRQMKHTGKTELAEAIGKYYPDWHKLLFVNERKKLVKTVRRK